LGEEKATTEYAIEQVGDRYYPIIVDREAGGHYEINNPLTGSVRDTQDRLDYYLKTREMGQRNDAEACRSSDFQKIEDRVKEGDYKEVFHFISHEDPDQQMVSKFQRSFQPVHYERFDGAAVVVYKVRQSVTEGLPQPEPPDVPQPEPPSNLPRQE